MRSLLPSFPLILALSLPACPMRSCGNDSTMTDSPVAASSSSAPVASASASAGVGAIASAPPVEAPKPCPEGMALIGDRLCVDRWEASVIGEDGQPHSPFQPVGTEKVVAVSKPGVSPQGYISLHQATKACERAGKRMCTTAEWLEACQGPSLPKRTYPYGNKHVKRACNDETRIHPASIVFPGQQRHDFNTLNNPKLNQLPDSLAKTGAYAQCTTPEGVHDMVGNLLEWTKGHDRPLLMGGHYVDSKVNGDGCHYVTPDHKEHYHDFTTGFRCCADSTPVSPAAIAPGHDSVAPASSQEPTPPLTPEQGRKAPRSFHNPYGFLPKVVRPPYEPSDAPCPRDMVLVEGPRWAMVQQVCKDFIDPPGMPQRACREYEPTVTSGATTQMRYCIDRYEFTPPGDKLPLVNVSWAEAQLLCRKMDKRICFEREWEFACEGPKALPYPYGYVRNAKACNHDLDNLFVRGNELHDRRVPADSLPDCKSPFGVFNIVGNVDEWTERPGNKAPDRSILRGGWWLMGRSRCRAATSSHNETYAGAQTGFRCCKPAR